MAKIINRAKLFFAIIFISFIFFVNPNFAQDKEPAHLLFPNDQMLNAVQEMKISLDIKGMDITDVLKMLATRAGINIVIGKNVTGKVTMFLKEVDSWDAFEILLLANELAYDKKGEIINVMTQRDYELSYGERFQDKKQIKIIRLGYAKASEISKSLLQIKTNIGKIVADDASSTLTLIDIPYKIAEMENFVKIADLPVETQIFDLNYAQADKLNAKLQDIITKGVGSIRMDERTNKIVITDYPEKLKEISAIINAFDEKTSQVLIDAQVIEIKPSDKFEMGIDWDFFIKKNFHLSAALPIGTTNRLLVGTAPLSPTKEGQFKAILDLLRTIGSTKILSSPRITAINNQEARILVGTKDAYITSTTSQAGSGSTVTSQSVNFVDVGIKLYVTPTINKDGFIMMKIRPEISSAERTNITSGGQVTQIPIVTTSEAETAIMIKDSVTIIIGGLRKDEKTKTEKKIPLLGDLPGIGFLFRSISEELKKTELVILLTPHIISGESFYDIGELKPKDGTVIKMLNGDIVSEKITSNEKKATINDYYQLLTQRLKILCLFNKLQKEKGIIELSFTLDSKGQLKNTPYVISSSNAKLNNSAFDCIKSASPFPAFPEDLNTIEETFRVTLDYN